MEGRSVVVSGDKPRVLRQAIRSVDRSTSVVVVDTGILNSTGRPAEARLLPRYRYQKQRRRRAETGAGEASLITSSKNMSSVSGLFCGIPIPAAGDGEEIITADEDNRDIVCGNFNCDDGNRIQSYCYETGPLLRQETHYNTSASEPRIDQLQKLNESNEAERYGSGDNSTESNARQPPAASSSAVTGDCEAVESVRFILNDQPNKVIRNSSRVAARRNWLRLSVLERSENTVINWWKSVRRGGVYGAGVICKRSGEDADDTEISRGRQSLFKLELMKPDITVSIDSSHDDCLVEAELLQTVQTVTPVVDGLKFNDRFLCRDDVSTSEQADTAAVMMLKQLRREQCVNCCRKFTAFLFSTVGSCCVLVGYVIVGGFMFRALEAENELNTKIDMRKVRLEHIRWLWNVTEEMNVLHPDSWSTEAERILASFTTRIYTATKIHGWDGKDGNSEQQWSYPGALLYSITVITTIGYGHITPKTTSGQVVTMIYAIFGIPLTLFTITNLGAIMATAFRFLYKYICCGLCCVCCRHRRRKLCRLTEVKSTISKTRNGTGRTTQLGIQRPGIEDTDDVEKIETFRCRLAAVFSGTMDINKVSVPIYVSLLLMTGYILLGATLFWLAEDWNFLVAAYFCFITLSTIGFGDYVPGNNFTASSPPAILSPPSSPPTSSSPVSSSMVTSPAAAGISLETWRSQKLVVCALYLVCGLALIAMCFDLMQESAKKKFRHLGRRLGLLPDAETN